ncbi:hypothetical protein DY956_01875 [Pseudomonas paraeruginosa]|nr:hypothetical protein DY956_01875 [Pseudomonas paraeruginosa]
MFPLGRLPKGLAGEDETRSRGRHGKQPGQQPSRPCCPPHEKAPPKRGFFIALDLSPRDSGAGAGPCRRRGCP